MSQLREDIEAIRKAKGEMCSKILEKQRKISSLESDSSTLTQVTSKWLNLHTLCTLLSWWFKFVSSFPERKMIELELLHLFCIQWFWTSNLVNVDIMVPYVVCLVPFAYATSLDFANLNISLFDLFSFICPFLLEYLVCYLDHNCFRLEIWKNHLLWVNSWVIWSRYKVYTDRAASIFKI